MSDEEAVPPVAGMVLYRTEDGRTRIECRFADQTLWLTQAQMAELFQTSVPNISAHLKAVYEEGELSAEATLKSYLIVQHETGRQVRRQVLHYSLPAIVAVGFRVRSQRGTEFRQWATATLSEYLAKGFALDDERLKYPPGPDVPDYFDELLERIRDIRASEARMYLRVRDILALAADYAPTAEDAKEVFQTVQNALHHAATGKTAAELIAARANSAEPNMGLTTWKGDVVRKHDVTVAKNYLTEPEIAELNRLVVMFLDYAEDQARRRKQIFLKEWPEKLKGFLEFNERRVLVGAGRVSRARAVKHAEAEYEAFSARRRELAEAAGEEETIRALEAAAKQLPKRDATGRKPKGGRK